MSKQLGIIIGVIVLLAVGALAYMQFGGKTTQPTDSSKTATENNKPEEGTVTGTIKGILSGGKNVSCTINDFGTTGGQAVVYVSGKNIRGDFSTLTDGKRVFSHIIQNNGTSYFWGDSMTQGIKMTIDLQAQADKLPPAQAQALDLNKEFNYTCVNWTVDNSVFTPPSDIKFTDMTSMMDSAKVTGTKTGPGYSCAGITDATAKAACENSMKQYGQ